ncbi:hypothetical protein POM88_049113 [Heracleum sosnowskyi]|uniref:Uncharacterized protein n=1 Tax=Heracleum sosnowskyi TaxID=360622 RepID=A0AAD8GX74_9APIA|nr:hypothetical protein POM88_049113 [Heracleum sosnowskyi]
MIRFEINKDIYPCNLRVEIKGLLCSGVYSMQGDQVPKSNQETHVRIFLRTIIYQSSSFGVLNVGVLNVEYDMTRLKQFSREYWKTLSDSRVGKTNFLMALWEFKDLAIIVFVSHVNRLKKVNRSTVLSWYCATTGIPTIILPVGKISMTLLVRPFEALVQILMIVSWVKFIREVIAELTMYLAISRHMSSSEIGVYT